MSTGGNVFGLLGLLFIGLKLTGCIDWSWWLVTLPFWGGLALALAIIFIGTVFDYARKDQKLDYQTGKKYDTKNGFKADIRYLYNGYLCGHVITDCTPSGHCMMHWTLDGFVLGADQGFDLIHPDNT